MLAGLYHHDPEDLLLEMAPGSVEVTVEQSMLDLAPSPPEEDVPPPPPPPLETLFAEETVPPPPVQRRQASKPIAKPRRGTPGAATSTSATAVILSAPYPDYPAAARERRITGHGVVVMTVNPASGTVIHVSMWKSTGDASLDNAALRGFRRWRFKPGSVSRVKSPVTFALSGSSI